MQNTEFGYGGRQNGGHECHKAFNDAVYGIIAIIDHQNIGVDIILYVLWCFFQEISWKRIF